VAGAAAAQGLLRQGLQVTVLDRLPEPAGAASGNPVALVHGTVHPDDGPYARLFRACALEAQRCYRQAAESQPGIAAMDGLLRLLDHAAAGSALRHALAHQQLPPDYVQALDPTAVGEQAGLAPFGRDLPAAHYAGGGWVQPAAWVSRVLSQPGLHFRGSAAVARIAQQDGAWRTFDATGTLLAEADVLVLACTACTPALLSPWLPEGWPLSATQGQVTQGRLPAGLPALRVPVAGDGYAIPLPDGGVLCGATRHAAPVSDIDRPLPVLQADHRVNLERLERLTGLTLEGPLQGRSAWRLHSDDRLPIAGAVPMAEAAAGARRDQARFLPRVPGLFVLTALGARGLTLAPMLGRLVAVQATGAPWPLEQDLADAIDPARWQVRAARLATLKKIPAAG
jgi:tRNA 5-methylaminomethyl-2-thiouridine biosynthesis bifunctional protein